MKKLILMALITVSTVAFAQVREGKVHNRAEAREMLEKRKEYTDYKKALESGKMSEKVKVAFTKYMNDSLEKIAGVKAEGLVSLVDILPDTASKITELMTLAKYGTAEQKVKAAMDLKIMSEGALLIDSTNKVTAEAEAKALEQISEMADYNPNAKTFKAELAKELKKGGITVTEAIVKASKGKITLEKIKDCII
jgi:DNA-directed RNA polymerase subunit F